MTVASHWFWPNIQRTWDFLKIFGRHLFGSYWICASQLQVGAVLAPSTNACIAATRSSCTAISPNPHASYQTRKRSLHWGMLAGLRFQLLEPTRGPFRAHAAIDIMAALYANVVTRLFAPVVLLFTQNFWTRSSHTRCTRIYYAPYYFALYRWLGPRRASLWSPRRGR
jgi:hypothetical protein